MSWVTVIWSMIAAASLTLAAAHLPVWARNREALPSLFLALMALATAVYAFCEMAVLRAQTPEEFAAVVRWAHIPIWLVVVALVGFVRTYLKAGRWWLAWSVVGLRTLSLLLNFTTGVNLNYSAITGLAGLPFLGETVPVPIGTPNPWMVIGNLSALALVAFVADASVTAWRRGNRSAAVTVGASATFFALAGAIQTMLVFWDVVRMPITISLFFLGLIVAIAYELGREVLRASRLVQELHESDQRMALAADAANLGIWVRDLARDELWASVRLRAMFGFTQTEALDPERLLERIHADDRDTVRQLLVGAPATNTEYDAEFRVTLPGNGVRWIAARGRVDVDERHRPTRSRGACSDVTARKQAELETLQLRQEIAHAGRVSVMGQLASSLAHEINQPLGAILRNAEAASLVLQEVPADLDEIRAIVDDIIHDDQRAGAVIDKMRALLRRHDIDMSPVLVDELLRDVAALVRPDAAARQIKITLEIAEGLPPVMGDRVHLQQVLLNLVSNGMDAIDAASRKDRRIAVLATRNGADTLEIAVSDNGSGIPQDGLERIFGSFYTTKPTGMGMGLSISRTLIETHGGRLWAENADGGGARLRFTLPIANSALRQPP